MCNPKPRPLSVEELAAYGRAIDATLAETGRRLADKGLLLEVDAEAWIGRAHPTQLVALAELTDPANHLIIPLEVYRDDLGMVRADAHQTRALLGLARIGLARCLGEFLRTAQFAADHAEDGVAEHLAGGLKT